MEVYSKPLPAVSELNRPFWDALRNRMLLLPKCNACGLVWYPPSPFCPDCWSKDFTWKRLSGKGQVNSWVVFHQAYFSSLKDDIPYNVAEVELDEGPRLLTNLVDVSNDKIEAGMIVEIVYDDVTENVTLAKFRPATN